MALISKVAMSTFETRLAAHFRRKLRHVAGDAALEQAIKTGILAPGHADIDGHRVKTFRLGRVVDGKSEAEIKRILQRSRRREIRQKWQFGEGENGFNLPSFDGGPAASEDATKTVAEGFAEPDDVEQAGTGIGERSDEGVSTLSAEALVRMVRRSAEALRAQDVATLLLVAQGFGLSRISLEEMLLVLSLPQPIVAVCCDVPGFEGSFVDLLERGLVLPGKVAFADGIKIRQGRGIGFSAGGEAQWEVIRFAGWECLGEDCDIGEAALRGYPILGVTEQREALPRGLTAAAMLYLDCGGLNAGIVSGTIEAVLGGIPEESLEADDYSLLGLPDLAIAIRPGISPSRSIVILREIIAAKLKAASDDEAPPKKMSDGKKPAQNSTATNSRGKDPGSGSEIIQPVQLTGDEIRDRSILRVETLSGYGEELTDWALSLKQDLQLWRSGFLPWSEMVSKLLLSGPPGTGKTQFARALCNSLGIPLIATSVATWLEGGHLGDVLKRMKKAFAEAREFSPCILFIDEIDGIGSRGRSRDHDDYWTTVINKGLELLDGAIKSSGVVIVGATNNPGVIDKALLRSGRLETHIEIPRPDTPALAGILRHHLRNDIDTVVASASSKARGGIARPSPDKSKKHPEANAGANAREDEPLAGADDESSRD